MKYFLFLVLVVVITAEPDPQTPVWPNAFEEAFDEVFIDGNKSQIVNGILYYDAANNRSRLDRANGQFDAFCSSILPNVTTPCVNLVRDGNRYIYFPSKKKCCMCCTAAKGCGILRPDWLSEAVYKGSEIIDERSFDKWSKDGTVGYNLYWNTADDNHIPRKIDQNGAHIIQFNIYSYKKRPQNPANFNLPDYCNSTCPSTTICGMFQKTQGHRPRLII